MKRIIVLSVAIVLMLLSAPKLAESNNNKTSAQWGVMDSKTYARDQLTKWKEKQWSCLSKLWGKESAWNPSAYNSIRVMGKNAGGIPQLLGLNPKTPPTRQIERGLSYIYYRYGTPCAAYDHFNKKGWH
jgi:hypothetical protein